MIFPLPGIPLIPGPVNKPGARGSVAGVPCLWNGDTLHIIYTEDDDDRTGSMKSTVRKDPKSYRERDYRRMQSQDDLVPSHIRVSETDLHILADRNVEVEAKELVLRYRMQIESYIARHPEFLTALSPLPFDNLAPPIVRDMLSAGKRADVGPMAAVAGVLSEYVGRDLLAGGIQEVIVENGGDIFLKRNKSCTVAIFAGQSSLSCKVGVVVAAGAMPAAVCTSSGTVGHSLSFGEADSVTVLASSTALADAVATRLGNEVGSAHGGEAGMRRTLALSRQFAGIDAVVVICGELMGVVGEVELVGL
jgi:uncharacterized protein